MVSMDFFTVPTITMKVLFVFIVLEHRRREVRHFNVTEHPSAAWTSQQIVEAFADQNPPRYLLRDRDRIYGNEVRLRIASLQTEEVLTAPRSPWQNPYAERLIGSIRRDCLDHFVILKARHLRRTRTLAACITVMNALQRNAMPAAAFWRTTGPGSHSQRAGVARHNPAYRAYSRGGRCFHAGIRVPYYGLL
jgi:hypothetical protein